MRSFVYLFLIILSTKAFSATDIDLSENQSDSLKGVDTSTIFIDEKILSNGRDDEWQYYFEQVGLLEDDVEKLTQPIESKKKKLCENDCALTENKYLLKVIENLQDEVQELKDTVDFLDEEQLVLRDSMEAVQNSPSPDFLAENNFMAVGTAYALFSAPNDDNQTFTVVVDPVFLWRYRDRTLFEMKLDIKLGDCDTNVELVYGVIDYLVNDCLIIRAGKFSTPLGLVWEKMTTGWINKLPTLPAPYRPSEYILTPPGEVGVNLRGTIPINWFCHEEGVLMPWVLAYDFWVSNGPDEDNGDIRLGCNYFDNNHNIALGGRLAFRPRPFREIAISGMVSQWNNNRHRAPRISEEKLWYEAVVLDWNWALNEKAKIMGELIYTHRDSVQNELIGIPGDHVSEFGGWFEYSMSLEDFCIGNCKLEDWEAVMRYSWVDTDRIDANRNILSFGLNYFFSNTLILKGSYEIYHGNLYPNHAFYLQLAHAY